MAASVHHVEVMGLGTISIAVMPVGNQVRVSLTMAGWTRPATMTIEEARHLGAAFKGAADAAQGGAPR